MRFLLLCLCRPHVYQLLYDLDDDVACSQERYCKLHVSIVQRRHFRVR